MKNPKDDYVILDSKTNLCYFKKATLESYLNSRKRIFNTTTEAIRFLGAKDMTTMKANKMYGMSNYQLLQSTEKKNHQSK